MHVTNTATKLMGIATPDTQDMMQVLSDTIPEDVSASNMFDEAVTTIMVNVAMVMRVQ
ncbi:hypothetical protein V7S43_014291 [Phytophthora oleae]|uniref:Uncharacterized protein n=1 Tax=Phytophthora oleae TaxID=2107226 RepID=A0ABD3F4E0_9STRA